MLFLWFLCLREGAECSIVFADTARAVFLSLSLFFHSPLQSRTGKGKGEARVGKEAAALWWFLRRTARGKWLRSGWEDPPYLLAKSSFKAQGQNPAAWLKRLSRERQLWMSWITAGKAVLGDLISLFFSSFSSKRSFCCSLTSAGIWSSSSRSPLMPWDNGRIGIVHPSAPPISEKGEFGENSSMFKDLQQLYQKAKGKRHPVCELSA